MGIQLGSRRSGTFRQLRRSDDATFSPVVDRLVLVACIHTQLTKSLCVSQTPKRNAEAAAARPTAKGKQASRSLLGRSLGSLCKLGKTPSNLPTGKWLNPTCDELHVDLKLCRFGNHEATTTNSCNGTRRLDCDASEAVRPFSPWIARWLGYLSQAPRGEFLFPLLSRHVGMYPSLLNPFGPDARISSRSRSP